MLVKQNFKLEGKRIWVTGHRGLVGSAVVRLLSREGNCTLLTTTRDELDLTRQSDVENWMEQNRPQVVIMTAAKVGGIMANNTYPADFMSENLDIENNIIKSAKRFGVEKLVFLGSVCIYPKFAKEPITEDQLLTGALEPTNESYALAKIAGIQLCRSYRRQYGCDFISLMPTNLYGPGDNFHLMDSHVLPALMAKIHTAKIEGRSMVEIWGSGNPRREFMHSDDLASAIVFSLRHYSDEMPINVGVGYDFSIRDTAEMLARIIGWNGRLVFNTNYPDGTPHRLLDTSRLNQLGWKPSIDLISGLRSTYSWFLKNESNSATRSLASAG